MSLIKEKYYNPCFEKIGDVSLNIADEYTRRELEKGVGSFGCSNVPEKVPNYDTAPCEQVIAGSHNSFIVLGRDRNESWFSGAGGAGMTESGMIDLVVGRGQLLIEQNKNKGYEPCRGLDLIGPGFHFDAARIYMSQKTLDIDKYFRLPNNRSGANESYGKSAVGIKADHTRIIARENVRIYCGRGDFQGFQNGETNCLGQSLDNQSIELQVGSLELQPMVLGNRLNDYLLKLNKERKFFYKAITEINTQLGLLNTALLSLSGVPLFANHIQKNFEAVSDSFTKVINTEVEKFNYLKDESILIDGTETILSSTVFTT